MWYSAHCLNFSSYWGDIDYCCSYHCHVIIFGKSFNSGPEAATNLGTNLTSLLYIVQHPETACLARTGRSGCFPLHSSGGWVAEDLPGGFSEAQLKDTRTRYWHDPEVLHSCSSGAVSPPNHKKKFIARKLVSNFMCLGTKRSTLLTDPFNYD